MAEETLERAAALIEDTLTATLCHDEYGDAANPTVVILHGLFGSGRNWMSVARRLADTWHVVTPDLRNHGGSPWLAPHTYAAMAADVIALIEDLRAPVALVGHSMGGKAAMVTALARPDLVSRLAVVDVAPVTYDATMIGYATAMREARLEGVTRRAEVDSQLVDAVPELGTRAFLLQNLVLDPGNVHWRVDLDTLADAMTDISAFPEIPDGLTYDGKTIFVIGGRSPYVRPDYGPVIRRLFPRAEPVVVPEAGHWVHAERLDEFVAVMRDFLAAPDARPPS
jgi:pimeloyl-ACP methyl ester carboxylesterase